MLVSLPVPMSLVDSDSRKIARAKFLQDFQSSFFLSYLTESSGSLMSICRSMVVVPCFYGLYIYEVWCEHNRCSVGAAGYL